MVELDAAGKAGVEEELTEAEGVNLRRAVSSTDDIQLSFASQPGWSVDAVFLAFGVLCCYASTGAV